MLAILAICAGACAGALMRWGANLLLNPLLANLPLGTLAVNWLGSFMMGLALGFFPLFGGSENWKLMAVTGFLGSFTTFSAFAGEMAGLLQSGRYWLCSTGIFLHVAGSIIMVFAGLGFFTLLRRWFA